MKVLRRVIELRRPIDAGHARASRTDGVVFPVAVDLLSIRAPRHISLRTPFVRVRGNWRITR